MLYQTVTNQPHPSYCTAMLLLWWLIILICFTNVLPIITNLTHCSIALQNQFFNVPTKFPVHHCQSIIALVISSPLVASHQFINAIGKFTNSCQWLTSGCNIFVVCGGRQYKMMLLSQAEIEIYMLTTAIKSRINNVVWHALYLGWKSSQSTFKITLHPFIHMMIHFRHSSKLLL